MSKYLLTLIATCLYYSGLEKLFLWSKQRKKQRELVILCYHRASGGDLRQHLLYLKQHYRLMHLEAALEELYAPPQQRQDKQDQRTLLALTFDDGYDDHATYAALLARELQVPITVFLIPGYIESGKNFWWQAGEDLVRHSQVNTVTIEGQSYHLKAEKDRKALIQAIDSHVRYAASVAKREQFLDSVHNILVGSGSTNTAERAALPLTWAQARTMEASGWVSFGAHTMNHPILAYLTDSAEVQSEVSECRAVLERQFKHPVRSFAYPVGKLEHIGEQGPFAVRQAEYCWAVTTLDGFNTPQTDPYLLRRIVVDVDQPWRMVAVKASGVWGYFTRLCRMPLTISQKYWRKTSI